MLPEKQPHPIQPYSVEVRTPIVPEVPAEASADPIIISYALTLFTLGAMIGLLALLGRIAQEMHSRALMIQPVLSGLAWTTVDYGESVLAPMISELDQPITRMIVLGFGVCFIGIISGTMLWFAHGRPINPRERRWAITGAWIVLWLVVGMISALFVTGSGARLTLLSAAFALALVGFVAFVLMVVVHALRTPP